MNELKLSVVMPNYNHGQYLGQAVADVLNQKYSAFEIVIIDDGSTDNSIEVVEEIISENQNANIRLFRNNQNRGVIYCGNRGLKLVSGEYVYFAAADDRIYPDFFLYSMQLLAQYPQAGLCSSIRKIVYPDGVGCLSPLKNPSSKGCYLDPSQCLKELCKYDSWMGGNSCIYKRSVVLECGGLIQELSASCDMFLGMLVARKQGVCFLPKQLVEFRLSQSGYSARFASSIDKPLSVYSYTANLMKSNYAELFPVEYVNAWERRITYPVRIGIIKQLFQNQVATMEEIVPKKNLLDVFIFFLIRSCMYAQFVVLLVYFYLRLDSDYRIVLKRQLVRKLRYLKGWLMLKKTMLSRKGA